MHIGGKIMCDLNSSIGTRIRQLRRSANMTQNDFGKLVNKDGTTIGRYEKDQLAVPSDVLEIISSHFEVSIDYIVLGKTNETQELDKYLTRVCYDALTLFQHLSDSDQKEIIEIMQFKLFKRGEEWNVWKLVDNAKSSPLEPDPKNSKIG